MREIALRALCLAGIITACGCSGGGAAGGLLPSTAGNGQPASRVTVKPSDVFTYFDPQTVSPNPADTSFPSFP
jgi:hypothetical protein